MDQLVFSDIESSDFDSEQESSVSKQYWIQNQLITLPKVITEIDLTDVLNFQNWQNFLDDQDKEELLQLLPEFKQTETLDFLLTGKQVNFCNPIVQFSENLKQGIFSKRNAKVLKHQKLLFDDRVYQHFQMVKDNLWNQVPNMQYDRLKYLFVRRQYAYHQFQSDSSSDESIFSINWSGCPSGESTIIYEEDEALIEASNQKQSQDSEKEQELKKQGNLDWVKFSQRFKDLNVHKNQLTVKLASQDWIENYRQQERERYRHPMVPWKYLLEDKQTCIVAPVCKKSTPNNIKARDHNCLVRDRQPYITALSVTRDAAAKLPDGVGTRADICQLVRESQYIVESASDTSISNLVSGALDRLHYEKDPCVRYDQERKLWIYLHKDRDIDYPSWINELPVKRGRPPTIQDSKTRDFVPPYMIQDNEI